MLSSGEKYCHFRVSFEIMISSHFLGLLFSSVTKMLVRVLMLEKRKSHTMETSLMCSAKQYASGYDVCWACGCAGQVLPVSPSSEAFVNALNHSLLVVVCLQESAAAKKKRKKKKKKAAAGGPEEASVAEANGHHEGAVSSQLPGTDGASADAGVSSSAGHEEEDGDDADEGEEPGGEATGGRGLRLSQEAERIA